MNLKSILLLALRIAGAAILLQTLYFKFTGHPESVILFTKLGVEPWGRIGTGVFELITGLLLLITPTVFFGAMIGIGLMFGAIGSHLFVIGIESAGDGGQLFYLAITELIICLLLALFYKKQGIEFLKRFFPSRFE
jgi:putative oxidoreductase